MLKFLLSLFFSSIAPFLMLRVYLLNFPKMLQHLLIDILDVLFSAEILPSQLVTIVSNFMSKVCQLYWGVICTIHKLPVLKRKIFVREKKIKCNFKICANFMLVNSDERRIYYKLKIYYWRKRDLKSKWLLLQNSSFYKVNVTA